MKLDPKLKPHPNDQVGYSLAKINELLWILTDHLTSREDDQEQQQKE